MIKPPGHYYFFLLLHLDMFFKIHYDMFLKIYK